MKVRELIEKLKELDPEHIVLYYDYESRTATTITGVEERRVAKEYDVEGNNQFLLCRKLDEDSDAFNIKSVLFS